MNIESIEELHDAWHEGMTDKEKDIHFCKMEIATARECQEHDRLLVCHFGLRDSIITMNKFHKSMERSSMDRLKNYLK